jgi:hypothetical protein
MRWVVNHSPKHTAHYGSPDRTWEAIYGSRKGDHEDQPLRDTSLLYSRQQNFTKLDMKSSIRNKIEGLENPVLPSCVTGLLDIEENSY